ncbi:hypothetical protein EP7_000139 [Isosphaeraceae bacterium EP7]
MTGRDASGKRVAWVSFLLMATIVAWPGMSAGADQPYEMPPIDYATSQPDDPIARLQKRLDSGEAKLVHDIRHGYLPSLLEHLKIPKSSQALVFSKTSFQHTKISRTRPRALYFGDDAYVGWVRGGDVLEVSSVDPKLGAVFYLLDQAEDERPKFVRQTHECLQCHVSPKTMGVPGHFVRSVVPDRTGSPIFSAGTHVTTHASPLDRRWGGWYVTGTHGTQTHMGNVASAETSQGRDADATLDTAAGANRTDLESLVNTDPYLTPHSDIVALMVLEHQTQTHNAITLAGYESRIALFQQDGMNKAFNDPPGTMSDGTRRRIEGAAEKLVRQLLFVEEAKLTDPIVGTTSFAHDYAGHAARDTKGRSLRDFDLTRRMFKYPCSDLIGSEAFEALPPPARSRVYLRLSEILTGKDQSPTFAHLSAEDRRAILEILRETRKNLPEAFGVPAD